MMNKIFATITLVLVASFLALVCCAQSRVPPPSNTQPAAGKDITVVDASELSAAIQKILKDAPNSFKNLSGELAPETGPFSKGRHYGLVNCSTAPKQSLISPQGGWYILQILVDVQKEVLAEGGIAALKVVKGALGEGTVITQEPDDFTITYSYKNSSRPEWMQLVIHPAGHLTVFIYRK